MNCLCILLWLCNDQNILIIICKVVVTSVSFISAKKLEEELEGWLRESGLDKSPDVRGVIAP